MNGLNEFNNQSINFDYSTILKNPKELENILKDANQSEQFLIGYLQNFKEYMATLPTTDEFTIRGFESITQFIDEMVSNHIERNPNNFQFSLPTIMPLFNILESCKNEEPNFMLNWETGFVPLWSKTMTKLESYVEAETNTNATYARTLEKYYLDPTHTLAIHGSCAQPKNVPSFFETGLKNTEPRSIETKGEVNSKPSLAYTAIIQSEETALVDFINYSYRQEGANIVIVLPTNAIVANNDETPIAIWQQEDNHLGENDLALLTPSYIMGGFMPNTKEFIENPNFNPDETHTIGEVTPNGLVYEINRSLLENSFEQTPNEEVQ